MSYLGTGPIFGDYPVKTFTANGVDTTFALDHSVPSDASIVVTLDGVRQHVGSYSAAGTTTLDFGAGNAPANNTSVEVVHLGISLTVGTPPDGTVTQAKLGLGEGEYYHNPNTIASNKTTTVATTNNGAMFGPITVSSGVAWTISGTLSIL